MFQDESPPRVDYFITIFTDTLQYNNEVTSCLAYQGLEEA